MSRRSRRHRQSKSKQVTLDLRDVGVLGKLDCPDGAPGVDIAQKMARILRDKGIVPQSTIHVDDPHNARGAYELDRWQSLLERVPGRFPRLKDWSERLMEQYRFELREVFSSVAVTGWVQEGETKYAVYVQRSDCDPPAGCNCEESAGERPCRHGRSFASFVANSLLDKNSELARRVRSLQFDAGQLRVKDFEPDKSAAFAKMLARINPPAVEDAYDNDDTLPAVETLPTQRIAWNLHLRKTYEMWELDCYLQTARKRSDGWTKGKKLTLDQLGSYSQLMTPRDERVRALVSASRRTIYSVYEWNLPVGDALIELVGADNVMLDGEPAMIRLFDAALTVHRDADECHFGLVKHQVGDKKKLLVLASDVVMTYRMASHEVWVKKLTDVQEHALSALMRLPPMPIKLWDQMVAKLTSFQHVLSVQLPDGYAVAIENDVAKPVVLLRSRDDGSLDYGMRVRLANHKLVKPSEGPLRWIAEKDGKSVQYVRDAEQERKVTENLLAALGLPAGQNYGTIRDFELSLRVIDQLQNLQAQGVETLWDKSSSQAIKVIGTVSPKNVSVNVAGKRDWFQLYGTCNLGDRSIDLADLLSSLEDHVVAEGAEYIRVRNEGWAKISGGLRKQLWELRESLNQDRNIWKVDATSAPAVRTLLGSDIPVTADSSWHECLARLERAEKLEPTLPFGINAELRDYQLEGFKWLRRLAEWRVGGVLADDMGLGKTLQTLSVIVDRMDEGPALVIAPTSVAFNWQREAERFAPGLLVHAYRETDRSEFLERVGPGDLVVCSYGLALRDAKKLAGVTWATMVLDEAQAIKNSRSKTSIAIASIPASWRVALTGTPVENHLGELWSLFHVISPGVFGGWEQFRKRFALPIERDDDEERRGALRDRLRPFILRRTKSQVLTDLPPRTEANVYVELSPKERTAYDAVRLAALGEISEIANLPDIQDQRFKLLALLTRLRQLACSPRLVQENWEERSSKLMTLLDHVRELQEEGHRVLVFSQFVQHLTLIREMFDDEQISYEYLDGSTPAADRQKCVDRFQHGDATAFLISLKAGGTGLNLTAADYVIHMDPWWNPAVEDQATDRAHRIGQDKPVMVYRMIAQGTIEEEILKLHESKRDLVAGIMDGAAASAKLSTQELVQLIRGN